MTKDNPILSVIIPVYNCAPVVERCLNSIDFQDSEIIVVNDGSNDSTAQVVVDYSLSHPNVRLITKENSGVSSARNTGIESAKGKYLVFIDADDYWVPGGIKRIVELAEQQSADVVKYRIISVFNDSPIDNKTVADKPIEIEIIDGCGAALLRNDISDYHVVDALFLRKTIIENRIRFHTDLHIREDDVFMGELYCHTKRVVSTDLPLYRYTRSSFFSSTHNQSVQRQRILIQSALLAIRYRLEYVSRFASRALPLERLKYMRFVCHPKTALDAGYTLEEYRHILNDYKRIGCYPLDYRWIRIARMSEGDLKRCFKLYLKTFLCNNPSLAFLLLKFNEKWS